MDKLVDLNASTSVPASKRKQLKQHPHHPPILATTDDILKKKHRVIDAGHIN